MPPSTSYISSERGWASTSGAALTIAKPANVVASDLLVAFLLEDGSGTLTTPAGWVQQATVVIGVSGTELRCITRKLDGTEPASWQFGTGPNVAGIVLAFHDANVGVVGSTKATGTTITAPEVASGEMAVRAFGSTVDSAFITEDSSGGSIVAVMDNTISWGALAGTYDATPTAAKTATVGPSGSNAGITLSFSFDNDTPNAPALVYPVDNQVFDRALAQTFDHTFSDPDVGDNQSQYELRYRLAGAGAWTETLQFTTTESEHVFAANYFPAGDYEWQARTADAGGLYGPWSASAFFTAADVPATPTITAPTVGETISQESYPVEWTAPSQTHYQVRTVADNVGAPDTSIIYQDTGEVASVDVRSRLMSFLVKDRSEHVQVRIKSGGLWSLWASVLVDVAYIAPEIPTLIITNQPSNGRNFIAITNPPPGAGVPAAIENHLFRRLVGEPSWDRIATGILPNGDGYDYTAVSNGEYEYKVRTIGDNGASSESEVSSSTLSLTGSWIHDPEDPDGTIHQFIYNDAGGNESYEDEATFIEYAGRSLPVVEYGEHFEHVVDVEITAEVDTGDYSALLALLRSRRVLCYRDSYGRKLFFAATGFSEKRRRWGSRFPLALRDTSYSEAV